MITHVYINTKKIFDSKKFAVNSDNDSYRLGSVGAVINGEPDIKYEDLVFCPDNYLIWTHGRIVSSNEATSSIINDLVKRINTLESKEDKDTTYNIATQSVSGLMSAEDKRKLDGIEEGAGNNNNTITGIKMNGVVKGTSGVVDLGVVLTEHQNLSNYSTKADTIKDLSISGKVITYTKADNTTGTLTTQDTITTYENATQDTDGLMSAADKKKLDELDNNRLKVTVCSLAEVGDDKNTIYLIKE